MSKISQLTASPPNNFFYFLRHGQSDSNAAGKISGKQDSPLTELGREQALSTKLYFQGLPITSVYTSPLIRAAETSKILINALDSAIPIMQHEGLIERSKGDLETLPRLEVQQIKKQAGFCFEDYGGESTETFNERIEGVLIEVLTHGGDHPLICSHSGVYTAITELLGVDRGSIENCLPYSFKYLPSDHNEEHGKWIKNLMEAAIMDTNILPSGVESAEFLIDG